MTSDESFEVYKRLLSERLERCRSTLQGMLMAFGSTSLETRNTAAGEFLRALQNLAEIITEQDRPKWLNPLTGSAHNFMAQQDESRTNALLQSIVKYFSAVLQSRTDERLAHSPFDFDRLYVELRDEKRLSELFDAHIDALTRIIECGEIDSNSILAALRELVEVLTANRKGSLPAVRESVIFSRFVYHSVMIALKKLPVVGTLVEAAEKTQQELDDVVGDLEKELDLRAGTLIRQSLVIQKATRAIETQSSPIRLPAPSSS
jgi:hypothetical protein